MKKPIKMNIYIIRHGQTQNNANQEYYGRLDVSLDIEGKKQMQKLIPILRDIRFDNVYSSSSKRATQSLQVCAPHLYNQIQIDHRLCELNFGDFEGKTYEQICQLYPQHIATWTNDWKNFCPPNGETFLSFFARVSSFFDELLMDDKQNILIMTHSGVIRSLYCYVLQKNTDLYWSFTCEHGKINKIQYEYGNLFISAINQGE